MLNLFEEFFSYFNLRQSSSKIRSLLTAVIFFSSLLLFALELNWIFSLLKLVKFIFIFSSIGLVSGIVLYLFLLKLGAIKLEWKSFWTILVSGILLTISISSKVNRAGLPERNNEQAIVIGASKFGEAISRIPIDIDGRTFELRAKVEKGSAPQKDDAIAIINYSGKLGFVIITEEKKR